MPKIDASTRAEALELLRKWLPVGAEVTAVAKGYTSASQTYTMLTVVNGGIFDVTGYVATVLGATRNKRGDVRFSGGGMDLSVGAVHHLSKLLHGRDDALTSRRI